MRTLYILLGLIAWVGASFAASLAGGGNFDHLSDSDRKVFQERFTKEIWPLLQRGGDKNSCVGCHGGKSDKIVSSLKMTGNAEKDFRMLVKEGFFIPDDPGSVHSRIISNNKKQMMPPPGRGERWTEKEAELLRKFVDDLEAKQQKKK